MLKLIALVMISFNTLAATPAEIAVVAKFSALVNPTIFIGRSCLRTLKYKRIRGSCDSFTKAYEELSIHSEKVKNLGVDVINEAVATDINYAIAFGNYGSVRYLAAKIEKLSNP